MLIHFSIDFKLQTKLPAVFIIDLAQSSGLSLPATAPAKLTLAHQLPDSDYFSMRRQLCRTIIAHYSGLDSAHIQIQKTKTGALEIYPPTGFHISLSYRGSLTAIALSTAPVGIDLEIHENNIDIPWNVLHPFERTTIERAETHNRMNIFYQIWTKKEACVKALGLGFAIPPDTFYVLPEQQHIRLKNKNIELEYKMLELFLDKTMHVSTANIPNSLKLV